MALTYNERTDTESPSSAGCSVDGGRSLRTFDLASVNTTDLVNALTDILGTTDLTASSDGRLKRTPPKADPQWPWMFAEAITSIRGIGLPTGDVPAQPGLEVPTIAGLHLALNYEVTVEFKPRPFPVSLDSSIQRTLPAVTAGGKSWYNFSGTEQTFYVVDEWSRYTDWTITPQNDSVTAQLGKMKFQSAVAATNGKYYGAMPRLYLPNGIVTYFWYQVPYRFLTSSNSYLKGRGWQGCVNQNLWNSWPAGSLLYLGTRVLKRYTPPVQQLQTFSVPGLGHLLELGLYSYQKLCDLAIDFLYTDRTIAAADLPLPAGPTNGNFIVGGHNLQPWLTDRQFHYAETVPAAGRGTPSWYSFPAELLFYDPDSPQLPISNT